ncbi:Gfo/Idh/MocA family protein [Leifsonia sp. EB34]|uniref:Gfo/Idh/MocA family protein n=1 Tax=Leifsonia sp. EB34 TaxID=3156303 RepID=UPI0035189A49
MNTENAPVERLRVAVVGCGVIGAQHAEVVVNTDDLELVALVDVVESKAQSLADKVETVLGAARPEVYTSLADALGAADLDLVAVCTPSGAHAAVAVAALDAGTHVIIEKPIDVSLTNARLVQDAADAARERGQVTSIISQHRFDAGSVAVSRAIEAGRLGTITSGSAAVSWWRSQDYYDSGEWRGTWDLDGGGAVMNQGVHSVDLLLWFLGKPVEVYAQTALLAHENMEVEDTAVATVRFESGALAVVHATTAAYPGLSARLQVHGSAGSAIIDNDRLLYFYAADADPEAADNNYGIGGTRNQAAHEVGSAEASENTRGSDDLQTAHAKQYLDVLHSIRTGADPVVGVQEATTALAVVRALYVSTTLGKPIRIADVLAGDEYDEVVLVTGGTAVLR